MAILSFNRFSVAIYFVLVIYISEKVIHALYDTLVYFKPGMPDFATAALLRCIEGA